MDLGDRCRGDRRRGRTRRTPPPAAVRARPRRWPRTTSNGSAGTWSRQRLNSSTSSGGNRPSPEEMIWPSLMNVGPSASAASRRRREMSATPAGPSARPRLRRHSHGTTARARRAVDHEPAAPGREPARRDQVRDLLGGERAQLLGLGPPRDPIAIEHPRRVVAEGAPFEIGWSTHRSPGWRRRARFRRDRHRPGRCSTVRPMSDGGVGEVLDAPVARLRQRGTAGPHLRAGRGVQVRRRRRVRVGAVPRPARHDHRQRRPALDRRGLPDRGHRVGRAGVHAVARRCGSRPAAGWATASAPSGSSSPPSLLFVGGSMACGAAQTIGQLVAFRVLQGVGGGMLTPIGIAMLFRAFPPIERARASTIVMIPTLVAPALGPVLGGLITDTVGWRWIFYVNVPFGAVALAFGWIYLREHTEPTRRALRHRRVRALGRRPGVDRLRHQPGPVRRLDRSVGGRARGSSVRWRSPRWCTSRPTSRTRCSPCACSSCGCSGRPTS